MGQGLGKIAEWIALGIIADMMHTSPFEEQEKTGRRERGREIHSRVRVGGRESIGDVKVGVAVLI
jgi:hypothetical protein